MVLKLKEKKMKQSKTFKFLVFSVMALTVATGCERRTRPPAKPPVAGGAGDGVAGDKTAASPAPETPATASPAPAGTTKTDDQKAEESNAAFAKYMTALADVKVSFIIIEAGPKTADGKETKVISEKVLAAFYEANKKLIGAEDAETLKKFKDVNALAQYMKDNLARVSTDPSQSGLDQIMENFIKAQGSLKIVDSKIAEATAANVAYAESVRAAIPAALKHIDGLK